MTAALEPRDARVEAAAAHWGPRFVHNGTDQEDFDETLTRIREWADWCREWGRTAQRYEALAVRADDWAAAFAALNAAGEPVLTIAVLNNKAWLLYEHGRLDEAIACAGALEAIDAELDARLASPAARASSRRQGAHHVATTRRVVPSAALDLLASLRPDPPLALAGGAAFAFPGLRSAGSALGGLGSVEVLQWSPAWRRGRSCGSWS